MSTQLNNNLASRRLLQYTKKLDDAFMSRDFRLAHEKSKTALLEMTSSQEVLFEIVSKNISNPSFLLSNRINPVIALPIHETPKYTLIANCWIPRPDGNTDLSHQSIHHHGNLLLSTVSAHGTGYESILFKNNYKVDSITGVTQMEIDKIYSNPKGNLDFIDTNAPHVVFYPSEVSITYALWSREQLDASASIKAFSFAKKYKKQLRSLLSALRIGKSMGLNYFENLDFYPDRGVIKQMKSRVQYPVGGNENFIQALQYLLQKIFYPDESAHSALSELRAGRPVRNEFETSHLFIEKVNQSRFDILSCFFKDKREPQRGVDESI